MGNDKSEHFTEEAQMARKHKEKMFNFFDNQGNINQNHSEREGEQAPRSVRETQAGAGENVHVGNTCFCR